MVKVEIGKERKKEIMCGLIKDIFEEGHRLGGDFNSYIIREETMKEKLLWFKEKEYTKEIVIGKFYASENDIYCTDLDYEDQFKELAEEYEKECGATTLIIDGKEKRCKKK